MSVQTTRIVSELGKNLPHILSKPKGTSGNMEDNALIKILEYSWVLLFAVAGWIMKKISLHDTSIKLLVQAQDRAEVTRLEEKAQHKLERREILTALDNHHSTVMSRLDNLCQDIDNRKKS